MRSKKQITSEFIYWKINKHCVFSSVGHGQKTGTNLHAALKEVDKTISYLKENSATNHFNETQNIIIIETDGKNHIVSQTPTQNSLLSAIAIAIYS